MLRSAHRRAIVMAAAAFGSFSHSDALAGTPLKLEYFDIRGLGEMPRIILKVGGVDFEDARFPIKFVDGKAEAPEFAAAKASGALDINLGRLPVLNVDGTVIGQSAAIQRYLARKCGMMGSTEEEAALVDCVVENVTDMKTAFRKIREMPEGEAKTEALSKWKSTGLAEWLLKLEKSLPSQAPDCAVGASTSLADVHIWFVLNEVFKAEEVVAELKPCTKLVAINNKVASTESLKKWLAERPVTAM